MTNKKDERAAIGFDAEAISNYWRLNGQAVSKPKSDTVIPSLAEVFAGNRQAQVEQEQQARERVVAQGKPIDVRTMLPPGSLDKEQVINGPTKKPTQD